ncbi:hypothetical protein [Mesorhizobium sp. 8]|uniref:hypothetical protein n=1 Tax=Mesorhizobium sp. 8 TaxID=2584466 RepID=UPI0011239262|nr:hypothetical protein [Mesorhizobium sp. 8]QDC00977.1 hypothetical protein FGU64_11400 [Mesorhizobium sp. 8]
MVRRRSGTGRAADGDGTEGSRQAPAAPATAIGWSDLSADEQTALKRLNRGPYQGLDAATAERLLALGLVARRPAGIGISRAGRELVISTLLAAREGGSGDGG